jgi:hypothetical protein
MTTKPKMTEEEALAIGRQAALELPQTELAFEGLEREMFEEMLLTAVEQVDKREKLFMAIRSLRGLKKALVRAARAAEVANYRAILAEETSLIRP